jgi:hypothetical protein
MMADIANTLNGAGEGRNHDAMILSIAGVALLALFGTIVALLPFDAAPDVSTVPLMFP